MIPQSKLYFKGSARATTISFAEAKKISEAIVNDYISADTVLKVGNDIFKKHTIDRVLTIKDLPDPQEAKDEDRKQFYEDERNDRKIALANEKRHLDLDFFDLICGSVGIKITEDLKEKAIEVQRQFFLAHPRRVLCSPTSFYPIFPVGWKSNGGEDKAIGTEMKMCGIRLVGLIAGRDRYLANDYA